MGMAYMVPHAKKIEAVSELENDMNFTTEDEFRAITEAEIDEITTITED